MKIDKERLILDAMQVVNRVLRNVSKLERKNPFRNPTKKELMKHPKLIEKQRRYLKVS